MSVAPRWKRRADEIAEAIGDELSINGTVSVGNDVSLSVATITALANAITSVLNPTTIARAMWTSDIVGTHDARAVYTVDGGGYWSITATGGVAGAAGSPPFIRQADGTTLISARSGAEDRHEDVIFLNNVWQLPIAIVRDVNVASTSTTPVHVQVRNIAGGFTAMGSDISTSMKLSAQPVSIADTVNVKTATGESVAITGTVNANVGGVTVPISNPNNITVPVVNTNSVTVPVSLGSVTVPVKATAAGIPQNANGISLYLPVDANHGLTIPVGGGVTSIPVANTNSVTVPVSGGTSSIPISGGTASVPVANTNNVTVPVTSSGTVLDVKIVEISTATPSGGVAPTTAFHEAMETALEDAEGITVNQNPTLLYGVCEGFSGNYMRVRSDDDGVVYNAQTIRISGTSPEVDVGSFANSGFSNAEKYQLRSLRVSTTATDALSVARNWRTLDIFPGGLDDVTNVAQHNTGIIHTNVANSASTTLVWDVLSSDGTHRLQQSVYHKTRFLVPSDVSTFRGRVVRRYDNNTDQWEVVELTTV